MKVTLARVDERLIHGQVMTAWCKKCWIKTIILVDKEIAQDEFMISVLEMSAPAGVKVIVKSPSDAVSLLAMIAAMIVLYYYLKILKMSTNWLNTVTH